MKRITETHHIPVIASNFTTEIAHAATSNPLPRESAAVEEKHGNVKHLNEVDDDACVRVRRWVGRQVCRLTYTNRRNST